MTEPQPGLEPGATLAAVALRNGQALPITLGEPIASGGSAFVYSGLDPSQREVVVKVARDRKTQLAFQVEREIFRKLASPHLPRLIASGVRAPYGMFLVFERLFPNPLQYMNRKPLRDKISAIYDGKAHYIPLPGPTALELAREHLAALEYLHKQGYAHCDVKIQNLMVRLDFGESRIGSQDYFDRIKRGAYRGVLIDAGGVRSVGYLNSLNAGEEDSRLIAPQCTPVFAPPEVVIEPHVYSQSMDVYATALLIYGLITGHTPYSHIQRKLDPSDLVCVWEFKLAENRGEISPINYEVIQNAFYPDCKFRGGAEARARFDTDLYKLLARHCDPNPEKRGTIRELARSFDELFGFTSNKVSAQLLRVASSQGAFERESTLFRLDEAGRAAPPEAVPPNPGDSGTFALVTDPNQLREKLPEDLARRRQRRASTRRSRTIRLEANAKTVPPKRRPTGIPEDVMPHFGSPPKPKAAPQPKGPASERLAPAAPPTGRPPQRPSGRLPQRPPSQPGGAPPTTRHGPSRRRPTGGVPPTVRHGPRPPGAPPSNPQAPPSPQAAPTPNPQGGGDETDLDFWGTGAPPPKRRRPTGAPASDRLPPISEGPERNGETLDPFIAAARKGPEAYLRDHPYPVLYLEHFGSCLIDEDAPTTKIRQTLSPPSAPCLFPVRFPEGRPGRGVSVGRANARDLQIRYASVSKLHAALAIDPNTSKWMISDLGSTNGTAVDEHQLTPLVPALLENQTRIRIGGESLVFFTGPGFYDYLTNYL